MVDPRLTAENLRRLLAVGAETRMVESTDETGGYLLSRLARVREMERNGERYPAELVRGSAKKAGEY